MIHNDNMYIWYSIYVIFISFSSTSHPHLILIHISSSSHLILISVLFYFILSNMQKQFWIILKSRMHCRQVESGSGTLVPTLHVVQHIIIYSTYILVLSHPHLILISPSSHPHSILISSSSSSHPHHISSSPHSHLILISSLPHSHLIPIPFISRVSS